MNLIIGNTSQLTPYFNELDSGIVTVTSRDFTPNKVGNQQFDRVVLTFGEHRTFLTSGYHIFKETNPLKLDLDYNDYVVMDKKFLRPEELHDLKGDPSKLKQHTNWTTEYTFETMLNEMIDYWMIKL